ncbi:uncharacterized protein LOC117605566 [Osmia lignaria lignaria]|uniref:uncharacterized protein LOC117605566 n=1 Tax=Osmia lignaria lignaria TaxID=1437193 RepID=UPI00402B0A73
MAYVTDMSKVYHHLGPREAATVYNTKGDVLRTTVSEFIKFVLNEDETPFYNWHLLEPGKYFQSERNLGINQEEKLQRQVDGSDMPPYSIPPRSSGIINRLPKFRCRLLRASIQAVI